MIRWCAWHKIFRCVIRWWTARETSVRWMATVAAAMRYTEAKMTAFAEEMMADIEKETVDFVPNYDASRQEPSVLACQSSPAVC